jgi:hypothetical protein
MNTSLNWVPADTASSHELYFGTDQGAVRNAGTGSPEYKGSVTLDTKSYDPGLLEPDTEYYWRADAVDNQGNTSKGPVWSFTTGRFLIVDDFEGYSDDDTSGEAIWQNWIDGFGVADNGAQVGNLMPPYAEREVVHSGSQSMPLLYSNIDGVTNSEAALVLTDGRDWTIAGVSELVIWFRGRVDNAAEPLYAAVANTSGSAVIVANDDTNAARARGWTRWAIPLQGFADQGIDLTNIDKIAIGLGTQGNPSAPGGSGNIHIDDITLY